MFKLLFRLVLLLIVAAAIVLALGGASADESRQSLLDQFVLLGQRLAEDDLRAEAVSGWSTHEHVEHVVLAAEGMYALIEKSEVPDDATSMSLMGQLVLNTGFIPRGKGEAPATTVPGELSIGALRLRLEALATHIRELDPDIIEGDERILGNHPYFGGFAAADWLRMMSVHGEHHDKIIADIGGASSAP